LIVADGILFALAQSGVCVTFDRISGRRLCYLNLSEDEVIRSLFFNKTNQSIINVSAYRRDNFSCLKCKSTQLNYIRKGEPDGGLEIFRQETLRWPGFIEFDDINAKVLTFSSDNRTYTIWDIVNYQPLWRIKDMLIQEVKITPGLLLLIYQDDNSQIKFEIRSIEDGNVLKNINYALHAGKKVEFIELFNGKLLIKQETETLNILDIRNNEVIVVSSLQFITPSAFVFLYEHQIFLTFQNHSINVWDFKGYLITSNFENHKLWNTSDNISISYITNAQDTIISFCKDEANETDDLGSINISDIVTGKCISKINFNREVDNFKKTASVKKYYCSIL